jgi:hypothetical protein
MITGQGVSNGVSSFFSYKIELTPFSHSPGKRDDQPWTAVRARLPFHSNALGCVGPKPASKLLPGSLKK